MGLKIFLEWPKNVWKVLYKIFFIHIKYLSYTSPTYAGNAASWSTTLALHIQIWPGYLASTFLWLLASLACAYYTTLNVIPNAVQRDTRFQWHLPCRWIC